MQGRNCAVILGRQAVLTIACLAIACLFTSHFGAEAAENAASNGPKIVFTSPEVPATEGYATDGTNHYLFSTNWTKNPHGAHKSKYGNYDLNSSILKYGPDWKQIDANMQPFAGLNPDLAHIGGAAYYNGKLYAPDEYWYSCQNFGAQTIAVYNADATGMPLIQHKDISSYRQEISAIAIVPSRNELYTSSFCDGSRLMVYNLKTLAFKGSLKLSRNIQKIQGLSWNPKRRLFAMTSDDPQQKTGDVYYISLKGRITGPIYTTPAWGEMEGVDYTQDTIRFLIGRHVYYLDPGNSQGR